MPVFENLRIHMVHGDNTKTAAFVSCKIVTEAGGLFLNSMALVRGANGLYLSFPSRKRDGQPVKGFEDYYYMEKTLKEMIQATAIEEFKKRCTELGVDPEAASAPLPPGQGGGGPKEEPREPQPAYNERQPSFDRPPSRGGFDRGGYGGGGGGGFDRGGYGGGGGGFDRGGYGGGGGGFDRGGYGGGGYGGGGGGYDRGGGRGGRGGGGGYDRGGRGGGGYDRGGRGGGGRGGYDRGGGGGYDRGENFGNRMSNFDRDNIGNRAPYGVPVTPPRPGSRFNPLTGLDKPADKENPVPDEGGEGEE